MEKSPTRRVIPSARGTGGDGLPVGHRLPGDDGTDGGGHFAAGVANRFGEAAAAGGGVDHRQRLFFSGGGGGGDLLAVGGEDAVGLRVVRQVGQLATLAADLLDPESLVAAEEDRAAVGGRVLDVGRAGAGDQLADVLAVLVHRVDVGVGARAGAGLSAAVDDRLIEVAGGELVDALRAGQTPQLDPCGADRKDVVLGFASRGFDRAHEGDRAAVRREGGFALVARRGRQRVRSAAGDADRVEVARLTWARPPLEDDVAAVGGDQRARVGVHPGGQLFLARTVGPHRPDVAFADEGNRVAVGGERRFAVGGVIRQLVEVAVLDREQPAFGRFRRQHFAFGFIDAVVFAHLREDDRAARSCRGGGRYDQREEGEEDADEGFLEHRMLLSERSVVGVHRCSDLEPYRPMTAAPPTGPRMARCGSRPSAARRGWCHSPLATGSGYFCADSARPVEAQFDYAGGDLAGAVAAGVAGDVELGGEGVEAALGGALADVELSGNLGSGGGAAGEGAL